MANLVTRNFKIYDVYAKVYNSELDSVGEEFIGTFPFVPSRLFVKRAISGLGGGENELINFKSDEREVTVSMPSMIMVDYEGCKELGEPDKFKENFSILLISLYRSLIEVAASFEVDEGKRRGEIMRKCFLEMSEYEILVEKFEEEIVDG